MVGYLRRNKTVVIQKTVHTLRTEVLAPLLVVFVVLKLAKLIDWPWYLVLAPFWIPLLLALAAFGWIYGRLRQQRSNGE